MRMEKRGASRKQCISFRHVKSGPWSISTEDREEAPLGSYFPLCIDCNCDLRTLKVG